MRLRIAGGFVFDPASGWEGQVRDLYVDKGRLVSRLAHVDRVLQVKNQAVFAGGLDLRGQVATYGLDFLRIWDGFLPPGELGLAYARLGYTHVHEPYLTLVTAGQVHRRLAALPVVDASASLVVNLRDLDLWLKDPDRLDEVAQALDLMLTRTRAWNLSIVEPFVRYRQEFYAHRALDTGAALPVLARLAQALGKKFFLEATPEVLAAAVLKPKAFHLANLGQALASDVLVEEALRHLAAGTTMDMGLMLPGPPSPALPVQVDLGWSRPLELAPLPDEGRGRRALAVARNHQGLNLAFSSRGPVRSPQADYPRMFSWWWDPEAGERDWGGELSPPQFSLSRWAWATRVLPARLLGLADRGHLGSGARADVAIYDLNPNTPVSDWAAGLARCRYLIKAGEMVIDDFKVVNPQVPRATYFKKTGASAPPLLTEICQYLSFRPENLWVPEELGGPWVGN